MKKQITNFSYLSNIDERIYCSQLLERFHKYKKTSISTATTFVDIRKLKFLEPILKNVGASYNIERPHPLCEKVVISFGNEKFISILEIISKEKLTHQAILGSIFSFGLDINRFGDIFVEEEHSYFTCLSTVVPFLKENFIKVGKVPIELRECEELHLIENHFEDISIIVSSLRLDLVVAKLSCQSRAKTIEYLKEGMVLLNYQNAVDGTIILREGDVLSIRGIGKFLIGDFQKVTKNNKKVLEVKRYV